MTTFLRYLHTEEQVRGTSGYFGGDATSVGGPIDDEERLKVDTTDQSFNKDAPGILDGQSNSEQGFYEIMKLIKARQKEMSPEEQLAFREMIRSGLDEESIRDY